MDTIQLQCGSCQKLMAISTEHLGGQVECPHCRAVVQTPTRQQVGLGPKTPAAPPPPEIRASDEGESIFGSPNAASDDIFDSGPSPSRSLADTPPPSRQAVVEEEPVTAYTEHPPAPATAHEDALPAMQQTRIVHKSSLGPLIAMIFLVPYAILTTAFVGYLLMQARNHPHPLDMLPDPRPDKKDGAPRSVERVKHDTPLAAHQKTTLGEPIPVGDLIVVPEKVAFDSLGDLALYLRCKNRSSSTAFNPINDYFLLAQPDKRGGKPYTYIDSPNLGHIYGCDVQWLKGAPGHEHPIENGNLNGTLKPNEEEVLVLRTIGKGQALHALATATAPIVWRVQLRRGFVPYRDKEVSATAVIGVQFNGSQIGKEG